MIIIIYNMACYQKIICPNCGSNNIIKSGRSARCTQRYRYQQQDCSTKTFMQKYRYEEESSGLMRAAKICVEPNTISAHIKTIRANIRSVDVDLIALKPNEAQVIDGLKSEKGSEGCI